jgi:hypothetical protein
VPSPPAPAAKKKSAWKTKKTAPKTVTWAPAPIVVNNIPPQKNLGQCVVCLDRTANVAFVACQHVCICQECSLKYVNKQCPMCRQESDRMNLIYA